MGVPGCGAAEMLGHVRLTPGPGFRPLNSALYYGQRLVFQRRLRQVVSSLIAAVIRHRRPQLFGAAQGKAHLHELQRDGYSLLGQLFGPAVVQEIHEYLADQEGFGRDGNACRKDEATAFTGMLSYPLTTILNCPYLLELANHPLILSIAAAYLKCKPTISSMGLRWSFPAEHACADIQRFHRDPDDWRFLKLFVYLTEVDRDAGPHIFVRGTHLTSGGAFSRLHDRPEIERLHGAERICTITGARGTGFVADTSGIHCGAVPKLGPRLIFEVQYSLLPVFAFGYKPVALESAPAVDPYINRLMIKFQPDGGPGLG